MRQLEDLEAQRDWEFDWEQIHKDRSAAIEAIGRGDYHSAMVAYCSAVRQLMQALRQSRNEPPGDSSVDLDLDP